MSGRYASITVFLDCAETGAQVGRLAARLASAHRSHLVAVYGINRGEAVGSAFARGPEAIAEVIGQARAREDQALRAAGEHLRYVTAARWLLWTDQISDEEVRSRLPFSTELRLLWADQVSDEALFHALHTDLVVLSAGGQGLPAGWTPERIVLEAGVPVLLVPAGWGGKPCASHVLLAWNGSREARRAITYALPLLTRAQAVTLLIVDADQRPGVHGAEPGADIAQLLARHDVRVEVAQENSARFGSVADAIGGMAAQAGCDLVVLGAYSRSRSAEIIFGGVTRSLLAQFGIPLLVSR